MTGIRLTRWSLLFAAVLSAPALAQTGTISGSVTTQKTGTPVQGARVQALSGTQVVSQVVTREDGVFRMPNLPAGTYSVVATRIGFALKRADNVQVTSGGTATTNFAMTEIITELNPVVTSASRKEEKALSAPASISVVDVRDIADRPSVTVTDHIKSLPGVQINQSGVMSSNVVARGFNNAFSGQLLMMQDYRFAGVPSLRVNIPSLMTASNEDIERIEFLLGPASALYGPNSSAGVMHVITKSPFTSQGTTLTVDGGNRSTFRGSLRHAGLMTPKVGYKISGEFFTAKDFEFKDPAEPAAFPAQAPAGRAGKVNQRDYDLQRATGEARLDIRPSATSEFVSTFGMSRIGSMIELTGANGAGQVKNWSYLSFQQRARIGRFFGQVFANLSNAGNKDSLDLSGTYLLRSGQPIVDKSRVFSGQLQHGFSFASGKQDFIYGVDGIWTNPVTGGTINGRNEDIDKIREIGGYIQSTTKLGPKVDLLAAIRVDNNDRVDGNQVSPRAAIVFKPNESNNFRFTYNRAFSTPANFSYFLDLIQTRNAGGSGFDVSVLGNPPKTGWQFNRGCSATGGTGGFCMKSFLTGSNDFVPASAALALPGLLTGARQLLINALTPQLGATLATGLVTQLQALRPTPAQVGSKIRYLGQTAELQPTQVADIDPLLASYNQTFELGYKGLLGAKTRLSVDLWREKRGDVGNPAGLATPSIFFDMASLGTYMTGALTQILIGAGQSQQVAAATAAAIWQGLSNNPSLPLAAVPLGTITFNSALTRNNAVYATYTSQKGKTATLSGIDIALDIVASDHLTLGGAYGYVSKDSFPNIVSSNGAPLLLNSPRHHGNVNAKWRDEAKGIGFDGRIRFNNAYGVNSGVYASGVDFQLPGQVGKYQYAGVEGATLIDLGFSYRLPFAGAQQLTWSVTGNNVTNQKKPTFPGVPAIGTTVMTRLSYTF